MNAGSTPRRELRLAVVCYGGVSLCVYMHGTTKELHRLVKASRLLAVAGESPDGAAAASRSERVYYDLLAAAAGPDGVRTEVVVDIIAGTSAGGINGVFLAKSLAHNVPQDVLRDLWFDRAEIKQMLRGPTWLPLLAKAPFLLARGAQTPPLRGDMSSWLYDALQGMDAGGQSPPELRTLMPDGHGLQLFVTMTDFYGYDRQISIADPKLAHDRRHRHVFQFRYEDDDDTLGQEHNFALAFAARATSCFPGAFPPVSVASFRAALPGVEGDLGAFFRLYEISGADVNRTYFVDGGVLDNRPFRHVIEAIRQKRADVEVDRKLLYLEPDPGTTTTPEASGRAPQTIAAVLGASSGIPRREPILDELLEVAQLNERVQRMRDVVDMSFDRIAEQVDEILKKVLDSGTAPPREAVAGWQRQLTEAAREDAGTAYVTYVRSKIGSAVDRLATTACNVCRYPTDANHAFLVRSVYRSWAEQAGLFDQGAKPSEAQIAFLRAFDLDYGLRRLQFVIAGVNAWYADAGKPGTPSRAQLDAVKTRLWQAVVQLREAISGKRFTPKLTAGLTGCFPEKDVADFLEREGFEPQRYVQLRRAELEALRDDLSTYLEGELKEFSPSLYRDMEQLTAGWEGPARKKILVRFLGFPFWDILLFPLQSVAQAGERDAVDVIRMSPLDSTLLHVPGGGMKLDGTGMGHFRAFFKRRYRENDYLWGRLDGAERLIGIVLGRDHPEFRTWCGRAFLAILDEEESALRLVEPLVRRLRHEAEALASVSVGEEPTAS